MRGKHCCNRNSAHKYSYAAALGILILGYASNYFASMIHSVSLNLVYWWATAFLVFASFQISPQRFSRFDQAVKGVFIVPTVVLLACFLPPFIFPQLYQLMAWRVLVGYLVSAGFWSTLLQLYRFEQPMRLRAWGDGHAMSLISGVMVAVASMISLPVLMCTMVGLLAVHVQKISREVVARKGESHLNLAGSLTLAMGMSWGYSFLRLAAASLSMTSMQSLFFCDCWKTMGIVMLADKMRSGVDKSVVLVDRTDGELRNIIPLVLGTGYVASVFWAVLMPGLGWGLPMRVFATVLVSACPCVITLAAPLVSFMNTKLAAVFAAQQTDNQLEDQCMRQNLIIVRSYYYLSIFLSSGGSYWLTGVWMSPWTAGLLMLAGQAALLVHTSIFMSYGYIRRSNKSLQQVIQMFYQSAFGVSSVKLGSKCNTNNRMPSGELNPDGSTRGVGENEHGNGTGFVTPDVKSGSEASAGSTNGSDEGSFFRPVPSEPRGGRGSTAASPVIAADVMDMDQTRGQDGSGQNTVEGVVTVLNFSPRLTPEPDTKGAVQGSGDGKKYSSSKLSPLNPVAGSQGSDVAGEGQAKGRKLPTKSKGAKSSVAANGFKPDAQGSKAKSKPKKASFKKRISQFVNGGGSSTSNTTAQQGGENSRSGKPKW